MTPTDVFSIERDSETVAAGGFFCAVCLEGKPANEQSEKPNRCHNCAKVLSDLLMEEERPTPAPRHKPHHTPPNQNLAVVKPPHPNRIPKQVKQPASGHSGKKKETQGVFNLG